MATPSTTSGYHSVGLSTSKVTAPIVPVTHVPNAASSSSHVNNSSLSSSCRVIMHVDMDAFYASVDRERFPHWRGKPICVVQNGTLVVSSNYHARCRGYPKMGRSTC
jgi:hypothetical protein